MNIKVCKPILLTPEQKKLARQIALRENRVWGGVAVHPKHLAVEVSYKWPNGSIISCGFLNGTDLQKQKTEYYAKRWEEFANIRFDFANQKKTDKDIRVAFNTDTAPFDDPGSWAYVGITSKFAPSGAQNVNFGWLDENESDDEWFRVVVHEFGHILGCDHELQSPAAHINWNKPVVYHWYMGPPNNWSKEDVDNNVLNPSPPQGIAFSAFDKNSIMTYPVSPEFTLDHQGVPGGSNYLTYNDKSFISQMYPGRYTPPMPPVQPDTLLVNGQEIGGMLPRGTTKEIPLVVDRPMQTSLMIFPANDWISVYDPNHKKLKYGKGLVSLILNPGKYLVRIRSDRDVDGEFHLSATGK